MGKETGGYNSIRKQKASPETAGRYIVQGRGKKEQRKRTTIAVVVRI